MNREMKDSGSQWIQDISNKWNNERLKYTITARDGGAWGEEPTKDNPGVICMRIADFNYDDGVFQDKPQEQLTKRLYTNNQINRLMLMQNDICIEKSGGGEKTPVGRTVIFDKAYPALFANFMERLRFNPNIIIPHFGEYWFRAMYSCKVSPVYIKQTTGIQNLDVGTMLAVERIYYPSLPEQRQIVHFLDRKCAAIDTAIEKTKESIEKLEEYKKAVITKAVTKGLDPDAKMKDSGVEWIGEVPETWGIGKLKYFYDITLGKMVNKDNSGDEGDSYLCAANIKWDGVNTDVHRRMIFTNKEKEQYLLNDGDVLIMEGGAAGTSCIYNNEFAPCYIQNSVNRCRGKKGHVNKFLYYWMHTAFYAGYINVACNQATIMHYTKEKVAETPFVRISEHEQLEIVNYLDKKCTEINNLITKKQEAINKWEEYKKSLIYYAVTGKIDCRNEVIE